MNRPAHDPQPGQAASSSAARSSSDILPALYSPTASNTFFTSTSAPLNRPAIIGPPLTNTAGMFSRAAAISIPGTILSQLGMNTSPSNPCAIAIVSTESAISSRDGRE